VTGFHYPSTRAVLTVARFPLAELTRLVETGLNECTAGSVVLPSVELARTGCFMTRPLLVNRPIVFFSRGL